MLRSKSLKKAGIFAYLLIAVNAISGFILGPTILSRVGTNIYGVYTTVNALVSTLMIADLGVSQTLIRFIADYKANRKEDIEISQFCKTVKAINYILVGIALIVGLVVYSIVPSIYKTTFSIDEIVTAQSLLLICLISIIATLLSNYYAGIIAGYGYFTYINITKTVSVLLKLVLSVTAVSVFEDVFIVVWINVVISVAVYLADLIFYKVCINIKLSFGFAQTKIFKAMSVYTLLIFVQTVVDQVNSNLDNIIIGAVAGSAAVAVYSFGLTIFHMFQQLSTSISQMLVPYMSDVVASGVGHLEIEDRLIKIGKIQYLIVGGIYFGFISIGREFIEIWLGPGYEEVWIVAVILMTGGLFPLIQNGAIALLKAKNLMGFRTATLFVAAMLNAVATIILVHYFGFVYASIGTALGFVVVNTIVMDVYYFKKLNLNMFRVLWNIVKKATLIDVICAMFSYLTKELLADQDICFNFIVSGLVFVVIYYPAVYYTVLTKIERTELFGRLSKR